MKHILKLGVIATAALIACAPAGAAQGTTTQAANTAGAGSAQAKALNKLADDYYDALARFDPVSAGESGDNRFADQIGMTIGPKQRAAQFALYKGFVKRLHAIRRDGLPRREQTSYDILDYELATALRFEPFPEHLLPINQMDSMPVTLANYASGQGAQSLSTVKDYQAYLNRLNQLGPWIDQAIANMREGIRRGIVLPKPLVVSSLPQFKQLVAARAEDSIYYGPVKNLPAAFPDADKKKLAAAYRATIDGKLNPALQRLAAFLETDYLPASRTSTGWSALPQGMDWYLVRVASQTTTDLQPEQIHQIGLKEVARIQGEYARIGPQMGYTGAAAGLPTWVSEQARYKPFKTDQEVIDVYRKLDAQLKTKLPALFTLRPKTPLDLRLEPERLRPLHPAGGGRFASGRVLVGGERPGPVRQHRHGHAVPARRAARPPLPHRPDAGAGLAELPQVRRQQRLYGRLGAVRRDPGPRNGPVRQAGRLFRPPERRDAARRAPGGRHRHARERLDPRAIDLLHARDPRVSGIDRAQRDRALHGMAGPGAGLQDRRPEDPGIAPPRGKRAGPEVQPAEVPRDRAGRRHAAAGAAGEEGGSLDR
jgi:hypothetical protein